MDVRGRTGEGQPELGRIRDAGCAVQPAGQGDADGVSGK